MKKSEPEILQGAPASAEEGMLFEPFFRSRQDSVRIQRTQTVAERRKFAVAFQMVGCVRCTTKQRPHKASGFCAACYSWYRSVLNKAQRPIESRSLPANVPPRALATGSPEPPVGGALVVLSHPQTKAETHSAIRPAPAPPRRQIARVKKPRVKPTVRLANQSGGRYWRIIFKSNGRPKTKWFASEGALSEEQAQALADAWLKEHHPEFFTDSIGLGAPPIGG